MQFVAFADDLAVIVEARTAEVLESNTAFAVQQITGKLQQMGIKVSRKKTEMVILAGGRRLTDMRIQDDDGIIKSSEKQNILEYTSIET